MSRSPIPSYRLHKQSRQAVVTLTDGLGGRRDVLLGKHGTLESQAEYHRVLAEWQARGRQLLKVPASFSAAGAGLSVNEVILAYFRHVEEYYRHPDGRPTSEVGNIRRALRWARKLYGHTSAATFDSIALDALRALMVAAGLCRNRVNKDVARLKRMFKWAAARKLAPVEVYQSLNTVEGLRAGRSEARETEPVRPVAWEVAEKALPFMAPQVAAMVRLQYHAGMRPGEVQVMRTCDLDVSGPVWRYTPGSDAGPHGQHKNAWRGHTRVILIGPRGQEVLKPWLRLNLHEYLFQPREAMALRNEERRRQRRTPLTPSQVARKPRAKPRRRPGERYTPSSYCVAIATACERAGVPHFHPNQLRHTKATEIRREAGLDAARAVLGHRTPIVTEVYAEADMAKAAAVMAKIG